jgi:flagellar basal-body rod modification protein FlgD
MTGIQGITGAAGPSATVSNPSAVLGKDDFLRLLVTQLRYQDPLNPLDQNQFLAQTAQFTSLEHLQNINAGIEGLTAVLGFGGLAESAALVGRSVRAASREVRYEGRPLTLPFTADAPVSSVIVDVRDAGGALVRRLLAGATPAGPAGVTWDGRDAAGQPMAAGAYTYHVSSSGGRAAAAEGVVTSVQVVDGRLVYRIGDAVVHPAEIFDVR